MKFENAGAIGSAAARAVEFARKHRCGFLIGQSALIGSQRDGHVRVLAEVVIDFDHEADRVSAEVRVPLPDSGMDVLAREFLGPCRCGDAYLAATIAIMLAHASGAGLETAVFMPESVL